MTLSLATVLLFASLGLVALAIGLLARRYSRPALGVGLAGLLVLATASTWLTWAGAGTAVDPRGKLAEAMRELDVTRSENGMLAGRLKIAEERGAALARAAEEARAEAARLGGQLQRVAGEQSATAQRLAASDARIVELSRQLQTSQAGPSATPASPPQVAPSDAAQRDRIASLEQDLGRARRDLATAQQQAARDKEAAARLDAELAAVRAAPQQQAARDRETIARLNAELAAALAGPAQHAGRDRETVRLHADLAAARAEVETLRRQARPPEPPPQATTRASAARIEPTARSVPTSATPAPETTPATTDAAAEWRQRLAVRLSTPRYVTEPLRAQELVSGLRGGWYVVRLEQQGRPLRFETRRFRKPEAAQDIAETARSLDRELIAPLKAAGLPVRLFLRGSADARGYTGTDELPDEGRVIDYLRRGRDGRFAAEPREQRAGRVVRNRELPNLRADWVREQITPTLGSVAGEGIAILDNPPAPGRERTVELVLYVGW